MFLLNFVVCEVLLRIYSRYLSSHRFILGKLSQNRIIRLFSIFHLSNILFFPHRKTEKYNHFQNVTRYTVCTKSEVELGSNIEEQKNLKILKRVTPVRGGSNCSLSHRVGTDKNYEI